MGSFPLNSEDSMTPGTTSKTSKARAWEQRSASERKTTGNSRNLGNFPPVSFRSIFSVNLSMSSCPRGQELTRQLPIFPGKPSQNMEPYKMPVRKDQRHDKTRHQETHVRNLNQEHRQHHGQHTNQPRGERNQRQHTIGLPPHLDQGNYLAGTECCPHLLRAAQDYQSSRYHAKGGRVNQYDQSHKNVPYKWHRIQEAGYHAKDENSHGEERTEQDQEQNLAALGYHLFGRAKVPVRRRTGRRLAAELHESAQVPVKNYPTNQAYRQPHQELKRQRRTEHKCNTCKY